MKRLSIMTITDCAATPATAKQHCATDFILYGAETAYRSASAAQSIAENVPPFCGGADNPCHPISAPPLD
jgi:hypothetical protein